MNRRNFKRQLSKKASVYIACMRILKCTLFVDCMIFLTGFAPLIFLSNLGLSVIVFPLISLVHLNDTTIYTPP